MSDETKECGCWDVFPRANAPDDPQVVQCPNTRPCPVHEPHMIPAEMIDPDEEDSGNTPPAPPQAGLRLVPPAPEKTDEERVRVRFVDRREEFIMALRLAAGHVEGGGVCGLAIGLTFADGNIATKVVLGPKGDALKVAGTLELMRHRLIEGLA